jgi:hypothetical protein
VQDGIEAPSNYLKRIVLATGQDLTSTPINLSAELLAAEEEEMESTPENEERVDDKRDKTFIENDDEMEQPDFEILESKRKRKKRQRKEQQALLRDKKKELEL